jgi:hypothetical protein
VKPLDPLRTFPELKTQGLKTLILYAPLVCLVFLVWFINTPRLTTKVLHTIHHSLFTTQLKTQNSRVVSGEQPEPYKAFKTYKKATKRINRSERSGRRWQIHCPLPRFTTHNSNLLYLSCMSCISCMVQFYTRVSNRCLPPSRL